MSTFTVGNYLVKRLTQLGLEHLFSIAGDYSIEWLDNYVEGSNIKVIQEVNELNAGYAADGYARLKGIGALCTTYSAGSLSAVNAIAGAYVEKVPIVLINGAPSIKRVLTYEQTGYSSHHFISGRETDRQVFEYITAATARIDNPDFAPMLIDYALTHCISEKRPVYIELLQDVVSLPCKAPDDKLECPRTLADEDSLNQSIAEISEKLATAVNPLIWVGVEIDRNGLQEKATRLIQQLNIPFVTDLLSKAVLSEKNPLFGGVFNGLASFDSTQDLVRKADFVLALGVWLTDINTLGWSPDIHKPDFDKTAFASLYTVKHGTFFKPQVPLGDLIDGLLKKNISVTTGVPKQQQVAQPTNSGSKSEESNITYQGFYDFISSYIDEDTIVGADASLNYFGSMLLNVNRPGGFIAQASYSSIGYIGPAATGICLATKSEQRVMIFTGDGGFQMTAQCLSTQTRFGLNPIIFVIDNGVFAVEQWLHDASQLPANKFSRQCMVHPWNYSKLAEVYRCQGWKVETYQELEAAVKEALAQHACPSVIQVVIPRNSFPHNAGFKIEVDAQRTKDTERETETMR